MKPKRFIDSLPISKLEGEPGCDKEIKNIVFHLQYGTPQGRCCSFTSVQDYHTAAIVPRFTVPIDSNLGPDDWLTRSHDGLGEFYCVDRSIDPVRCAGILYKLPDVTLEEMVVNAMAYANREGANPGECYLPSLLLPKDEIIFTCYGRVECYSCDDLTSDLFLLQRDTWIRYNNTVICTAPGYNLRGIISEA